MRIFLVILLLTGGMAKSQSLHYINYTVKDGLAGSIVYSMCQDKDGFMWFGTDNGLSRYDGTHFTNFTIKDGLPDNEVIKVAPDNKGRVWIGSFSKEICYYYNGKIYNHTNDSLVKKIKLESNPESLFEASNHFFCIASRKRIYIVTPNDSLLMFKTGNLCSDPNLGGTTHNFYGKLRVKTEDHTIVDFNFTTYTWEKKYHVKEPEGVADSSVGWFAVDSTETKKIYVWWPGHIYNVEPSSTLPKFLSCYEGSWLLDSISLKPTIHFLKGLPITHTLEDREKNIWFTSLGKGLYKLPSLSIKTISFNQNTPEPREVYSIIKYKNSLLAGSNDSRAFLIDNELKNKELNLSRDLLFIYKFEGTTNRLFSAVEISNSTAILGFDGGIAKLDNGNYAFKYLNGPIKSVEKINDSFFIAGTAYYALKIRVKDLQVTDTIWRERCTKVFFTNGKYYIGTLSGLYEVNSDKSYFYLGKLHPVLSRRITDVKIDPQGVLWVSTSDKGVVGIKERKIKKVLDDTSGLSSNNCKTLFIKDHYLWIGTNNGICKVNTLDNADITKYSESDGLPSNNINALYIKDGIIWIGSPEGVTYFSEKDIASSSICNLTITRTTIGGSPVVTTAAYQLQHDNNNIRFEFSGISFRSGNEIIYYYKLNELDKEWKTTTQNYLDYKTLPPGDYTLELYAINKYGVKSNIINILIKVAAPFWKTIWFYVLVGAGILAAVVYLLNRRNKLTKQKLEETNRQQKQFAELEQQALQSQMNPHFIFNCLNSIQQYILTRDTEKANLYLTEFAYLIRQTLNISSQKSITLSEEVEYLNRYLYMERMRFGNSFTYNICTEDISNTQTVHIPSLLIQPFVENSLRHGIRYLTDKQGRIDINFSVSDNILLCSVRDNGVGREKAAEYKSKQHIEYQSKGMSLTSKRINLLNTISEKKIVLSVTDLKDIDGVPTGTLVELAITL